MPETGKTRIVLPARIGRDEVIRVQVIVQHPMDTGFFRDANAVIIPAWFIRDVRVTYAGEEIARFEWTSGVSKDPMLSFQLRATREGPLVFVWRDNRDKEYTGSTEIKFSAA